MSERIKLSEGVVVFLLISSIKEEKIWHVVVKGDALEDLLDDVGVGDGITVSTAQLFRWKHSNRVESVLTSDSDWLISSSAGSILIETRRFWEEIPFVRVRGRVESVNQMGWYCIRPQHSIRSVYIYFTHVKLDKDSRKWDSACAGAEVELINVLPINLYGQTYGFAFTVRSYLCVLYTPHTQDERKSLKPTFSVPSIRRNRCVAYSAWVCRMVAKCRPFQAAWNLSDNNFRMFCEDLVLKIEACLSSQGNNTSWGELLAVQRNIEMEFSDETYYDLFVGRAGQDCEFLSILLPKFVSLQRCRSRSISVATSWGQPSYSREIESSMVELSALFGLQCLLLVLKILRVERRNGLFWLRACDPQDDAVEVLVMLLDELGHPLDDRRVFESLQQGVQKFGPLLAFLQNPVWLREEPASSISSPFMFCLPLSRLVAAGCGYCFPLDWPHRPVVSAGCSGNLVSASLRELLTVGDYDGPIVAVIVQKDVVLHEFNDQWQAKTEDRPHAFTEARKFCFLLRDVRAPDLVALYVSEPVGNSFVHPKELPVGAIVMLQGLSLSVSRAKKKVYLSLPADKEDSGIGESAAIFLIPLPLLTSLYVEIRGLVSAEEAGYLESRYSNPRIPKNPHDLQAFHLANPALTVDQRWLSTFSELQGSTARYLCGPTTSGAGCGSLYLLWRVVASVVFVRKVDVSLRCWVCQQTARPARTGSLSGRAVHRFDRFACPKCDQSFHLRPFWQLTAAVDDGTAECNLHCEGEVAVSLLSTRLDRMAAGRSQVLEAIEAECERTGSFLFDPLGDVARGAPSSLHPNTLGEEEEDLQLFEAATFDGLLNDLLAGRYREQPLQALRTLLRHFDYTRLCEFVVRVDLSKHLSSAPPAAATAKPQRERSLLLQPSNDLPGLRHFSETRRRPTRQWSKLDLQCFRVLPLSPPVVEEALREQSSRLLQELRT